MLKIDLDNYQHQSALKLIKLFYSLPLPFFVRKSSSGDGLHIKCPGADTWHFLRYIYDDPMRITLDEIRERAGLTVSNLLWDVKMGKRAGEWTPCEHREDVIRICETFITDTANTYIVPRTYLVVPQKGGKDKNETPRRNIRGAIHTHEAPARKEKTRQHRRGY